MSPPIGITLLGCGIVGGGVVELLSTQSDLLRRRCGVGFDLLHVVVRDVSKRRDLPPGVRVGSDAEAAIDDPAVKIVVELVGGTDPAGRWIERALRAGKSVVTANKSLLARRGPELLAMARDHGSVIAFEASCGGGIPIIDALQRGLAANRIDSLAGIVNGTCNYILTRMTREGLCYTDALRGAQAAGFAEADPTLDVSGRDAAQKLTILAGLAFAARISESDVHVEGIESIDPRDIAFARELGYVIKLLAIAQQTHAGVSLRVHPALVHTGDVLADVGGAFNAISVFGHALGPALFYGKGAGRMPTASAVVADLLAVATGSARLLFDQSHCLPDRTRPARVLPITDLLSRFYLRLSAVDAPGVLARVTDALGKAGVSLSAVLQHETSDAGLAVPVVITTHLAREGDLRRAIEQINALDVIAAPAVCLRVYEGAG